MSRLGIRWSGSIRISTSSSLIPLNRSRFFLRFASSGDSPYCCCDAWCWADMALWLLLWLQLHNTTVNWRMNAIKLFTMHIQLANSRSAIRTADFAPVYNSLHHNVTGLWLAASATAHSLARTSYLCGYTVRLAGCSSVTSAPLHMAQHVQIYDVIQYPQEAQLSRRDRAMRHVNWNLANCHATVQKLLIRQVLTKSMVWSWRFSRRQCVINNVHSTKTWSCRLPLSQVS